MSSAMRVMVGSAAGNWRRVMLGGAIDVIAGLAALIWPGVTVLALAILLGVLLLISGIASIGIGRRTNATWLVVLGVIALIAAVICFVHPGAGVFAILLGCAIWFFMNGVSDLVAAFSGVRDRALWGVLGALSIVASVIMISEPGVAIVTVAIIVGISFLARGAVELMIGRRLRAIDRALAR